MGTLETARQKAARLVSAYVIKKKLVRIGATAARSPRSRPAWAMAQQMMMAMRGRRHGE